MQNKEINLTEARVVASGLAMDAGDILKKRFLSQRVIVSKEKGSINFSTNADVEAETLIIRGLRKRFPQIPILSEEEAEETARDGYESFKEFDWLWVNDPLDGTANFTHGFPRFAVSISLIRRGEPVLGVVYMPMSNELLSAQADRKLARLNGRPIHVSPVDNLRRASFLCDWCPAEDQRRLMIDYLNNIVGEVWQIKSQGSAVADLCSVAIGQSEAYINPGLKPWDIAGPTIIVEKAGGQVSNRSGGKLDIFKADIFASNGILHQPILDLINK